VARGGLDEYAIADLVAASAPIDAYGVGTKMGVSADAPYLDTAFKLVDYDGRPVMKLSPDKVTLPGAKQVHRGPEGDVIALRTEPLPSGYEPLLVPVMREGRRLGPPEPIADAIRRCSASVRALPPDAIALHAPAPVPVTTSAELARLRDRVRHQFRRQGTR
jgi:nicotinate phosphoribosyltransferase